MIYRHFALLTGSLLLLLYHPIQADEGPSKPVRVATYNVSLYRGQSGQLARELRGGKNQQAMRIAHVIRTIRPDVLLLNEFDFDANQASAGDFCKHYLESESELSQPIRYAYRYSNEVNTGVPSGMDLDQDGKTDGPGDAFGYGKHPGQYGMLVLSRFPINASRVRTFQKFLWQDMPHALLPQVPSTKKEADLANSKPFYPPNVQAKLRLSSKSHWDVPILIGNHTLHFLVSHPTPPIFDGPEDRNGKRNHDEIRLFADYIAPERSGYLVDDLGVRGGLPKGSHFVIAGDLNADPEDGASYEHAIRQLTQHPLVQSEPVPAGKGSLEQADKGANRQHQGNPSQDTADFDDRRTGNLRADYVLPSTTMSIAASGVYWPPTSDASSKLASATDHRMVWVDLQLPSE